MKKSLWLYSTLLVLGGCVRSAVLLTPAPAARTLRGAPDVATSEVDGVRVEVRAEAWMGSRAVTRSVEPVRVTIDNDSDRPIRIRYGDFALVAPDGRGYAALPPFRVAGALASPVLVEGFTVIVTPRFAYHGFMVAPYFGRMYPGIPVYPGRYAFYDPYYYGLYSRRLAIRPDREMLSRALPEGVIEPGGSVSGFLYFQRIEHGVSAVTFRASLVSIGDAESESPAEEASFGEISIPFTVTTGRP